MKKKTVFLFSLLPLLITYPAASEKLESVAFEVTTSPGSTVTGTYYNNFKRINPTIGTVAIDIKAEVNTLLRWKEEIQEVKALDPKNQKYRLLRENDWYTFFWYRKIDDVCLKDDPDAEKIGINATWVLKSRNKTNPNSYRTLSKIWNLHKKSDLAELKKHLQEEVKQQYVEWDQVSFWICTYTPEGTKNNWVEIEEGTTIKDLMKESQELGYFEGNVKDLGTELKRLTPQDQYLPAIPLQKEGGKVKRKYFLTLFAIGTIAGAFYQLYNPNSYWNNRKNKDI